MSQWYAVVQYDQVDIRGYGDQGPCYTPGDPRWAEVTFAKDEDEAIAKVAREHGYYSAHPFDAASPRKFKLVEEA
jgi:hypothetical protein